MSEKKNEQIKIYIVLVLLLVMGILAYFQLIHKKSAPEETNVSTNVSRSVSTNVSTNLPPAIFDISKVLTKRSKGGKWGKQTDTQTPGSLPRDIFTTLKFLNDIRDELGEEMIEAPTSTLELKGTIIGGGNPMAIIDSQFLKVGDMIGEYKLISIGKKNVLLTLGDEKIKVEMKPK